MSKRIFNADSDPVDVLSHYWGYDSFRPKQLDIIRSVLDGHDTLGLMPTGGGKSLTFQVPAMMLDGLTIIITPLVSLMKDQVDNLAARDIRACCLFSGMTRREQTLVYDKCRLGKTNMLYVAPERLRSQSFLENLRLWQVSLIVVDEAHCISQWGYDFRPSYLRIADIRKIVGETVPVLALTASATPIVRDDITRHLHFRPGHQQFTLSFARDNISYIVRDTHDKDNKLIEVLNNTHGSAIVYVRSRERTKALATMLQARGISADFYHAGLVPEDKSQKQDRWKSGETRVIVATNAFGMGIDKADVRVVIHYQLPPSIEEYYQEAGRAGRDGLPSFAVVIASKQDKATLARNLAATFPPKDYIKHIYDLVGSFLNVAVGDGYNKVYEFDLEKFVQTYRLSAQDVRGALAILTQSQYIDYVDDAHSRSRVMMLCRRDELYSLDLPPDADTVLMSLLRFYTGVFADYVFINETRLALNADTSVDTVYQSLLLLSRMKVLHYVPRSANPYICYTTSRELSKYLTIPRAVYEDRRALYEQRLNAVKRLAFDDTTCRQRTILEYFGETVTGDCGHCDVCRARIRTQKHTRQTEDDLRRYVLRNAAHPGGTTIARLTAGNYVAPKDEVIDTLRQLLDESAVTITPDGTITLP